MSNNLQMYKATAGLTHSVLLSTASKELILQWSEIFDQMPIIAILISTQPYIQLICSVCEPSEVKNVMTAISKIILKRQSEFSVPNYEVADPEWQWLFEREALLRSLIKLWIQSSHEIIKNTSNSSSVRQTFLTESMINIFIIYEEQVIDHTTQTWTLTQLISFLAEGHLTAEQISQFAERIHAYSRKLLTLEEKNAVRWLLIDSNFKISIELVSEVAKSLIKDVLKTDQFDLIVKVTLVLFKYLKEEKTSSTETIILIRDLMSSLNSFESRVHSLNYQQKNQLVELENNWDQYKHHCQSIKQENSEQEQEVDRDEKDTQLEELSSAFATFNPNITDF